MMSRWHTRSTSRWPGSGCGTAAHAALARDFVGWLRVEFLGTAAATGLIGALDEPRTLDVSSTPSGWSTSTCSRASCRWGHPWSAGAPRQALAARRGGRPGDGGRRGRQPGRTARGGRRLRRRRLPAPRHPAARRRARATTSTATALSWPAPRASRAAPAPVPRRRGAVPRCPAGAVGRLRVGRRPPARRRRRRRRPRHGGRRRPGRRRPRGREPAGVGPGRPVLGPHRRRPGAPGRSTRD